MTEINTSIISIGIIQKITKEAPQKRKWVKRLVTRAAIDAGTKKEAKIPKDMSKSGYKAHLVELYLGKAISRLTAVQVNVKIQLILATLFECSAINVP